MPDEVIVQILDSDSESEYQQVERDFHRHLFREIKQIKELINIIMVTQQDIDNLVAHENANISIIGTAVSGLVDSTAKIDAEIKALQAANPDLDLSGLIAAQSSADANLTALTDAATGVAAEANIVPPPVVTPPAASATGTTTNVDGSVTTTFSDGSTQTVNADGTPGLSTPPTVAANPGAPQVVFETDAQRAFRLEQEALRAAANPIQN